MPELGKIPDNFDPIALVEKAIESDLDVSVFDQVIDTDVRWPKNWIEWVRGHSFLNIDPFPRQIELCTNFLGEFCPRCTNPKYLTAHEKFGHQQLTIEVDEPLPEILDNVVFLVEGICPKCRVRRNEMLKSREIQHFTNMNGCAGMRSSKTVMGGGLLATYQLVRFLRLPSPSSYFGLMDNQMLHITFVALTAGQAYDTLWQAFYDRIDNSPWFREYHAFLASEGQRLSKDLFDLKDTFLWYGHKRIAASFCGPDIRTIRGRTRIFCVTGDTLVPTTKGVLRIKDLADGKPDGFSLLTLDVISEDGNDTATTLFRSGAPTPVRKVVTKHGYEISATKCHPLRVLDGKAGRTWKENEKIVPGDFVVLKRGWTFPKKRVSIDVGLYAVKGQYGLYDIPEQIDADLAWLMGLVVAEGNAWYDSDQRGGVKVTTGDIEIKDRFCRLFQRLFGHEPGVYQKDNLWRVSCQSPRVGRLFIDLGCGGISSTKSVPWSILQSPKVVASAFLRGYFDGDAHAEPLSIVVHSASEGLLREVQVLLLGFGVVASRSSYTRYEKRYWIIRINGRDVDQFHEAVGFSLERKQLTLPVLRTNPEPIPVQDIDQVIRARLPGTYRYHCEDGTERKLGLCEHTAFFETPTRGRLGKLDLEPLSRVDSTLASNLDDARERRDLFYDLVVSVSDQEDEETFDLHVPESHAFVTNGIISHNTGMDEKGWFDVQSESTAMSSKVRMNAQETHQALVKSLQTIRSAALKLRDTENENAPDGLNVDVSSPSSLNDAIMVGLREANKKPSTFAWHYATWEVNPNITLDSLKDEMVNQVIFDRDYGGIPPLGANQFISDTRAVEKLQNGENQKQYISWVRRYNTDEFGDKTMYLEVNPVVTEKRRPRILTVDTGFSNNSFAITLFSYDAQLKKPVCDLALECMPEENEGERITINFPLMFEYAIIPILKAFNVIMAGYDRWNSIDQVQRLRKDFGVEALQLSLKKADFDMVRSNLLDGMSGLPQAEVEMDTVRRSDKQFMELVKEIPVTHLLLQILTVREAGRKVIKPINGTDDLWRCLCLALAIILDPKHTRKFERYGYAGRSRGGVLGAVRGSREFRNNDAPMSARPQTPTVTAAKRSFIPSIK